jgi:hypothetical protein
MLFRHLSVVEGDQRRDATDAVSRGNRRFLVDVDLGKAGARFELLSGAPSWPYGLRREKRASGGANWMAPDALSLRLQTDIGLLFFTDICAMQFSFKPVFTGWIILLAQVPLQLFFTIWSGGFFGGMTSIAFLSKSKIQFIFFGPLRFLVYR